MVNKDMVKCFLGFILLCSEFVEVFWTVHAMDRYKERCLLHGVTRTELEEIIRKQKVRIPKGFDEAYGKYKFETIGLAAGKWFTVQKAEDKQKIIVITLWESNEKEEEIWLSNQK